MNDDAFKYSLPIIPVRQTRKPNANTHIEVNVSPAENRDLLQKRNNCIDFFEEFRKHIGKKGGSIDEKLSTNTNLEKYVNELINLVDTYASTLKGIVSKVPPFATVLFYHWSSSLTDKQDLAFDDYRYDVQGMYYNVGAILMDIAQYLLCVRVTVGTLSFLEKDAYRALLKASAYFHICGDIVDNMKAHQIGVAELPIPLDVDKGMLKFLESLALAQAQEIAVSKAFAADPKEASDTTARLSHQLLLMYEEVRANAQLVSSRNAAFTEVSTLAVIKCGVFRAVAYQHAASCMFNKNPSAGLGILTQGSDHCRILVDYLEQSRKGKLKLPCNSEHFVEVNSKFVTTNNDRLTKINSLVHRVKPDISGAQLPSPQPLAIRPDICLPFRLEEASLEAP